MGGGRDDDDNVGLCVSFTRPLDSESFFFLRALKKKKKRTACCRQLGAKKKKNPPPDTLTHTNVVLVCPLDHVE